MLHSKAKYEKQFVRSDQYHSVDLDLWLGFTKIVEVILKQKEQNILLDFFGYHSSTNEYISTKIENITSIHFQNLDYEKILFAKVLYVVKLQTFHSNCTT